MKTAAPKIHPKDEAKIRHVARQRGITPSSAKVEIVQDGLADWLNKQTLVLPQRFLD